jgi:hypothetical protein
MSRSTATTSTFAAQPSTRIARRAARRPRSRRTFIRASPSSRALALNVRVVVAATRRFAATRTRTHRLNAEQRKPYRTRDAKGRGRRRASRGTQRRGRRAMARSPRRGGRGSANARGATDASPLGRATPRARSDDDAGTRDVGGDDDARRSSSDDGDGDGRTRAPRERDDGRVDGSDDTALDGAEDGFRLMNKAPPLTAEMIAELDAVETRRVLARWSARMRSVKRRVEDCARQFPTSNLVLVFTKPFRSVENQYKWCVERRRRARDIDATPRD